MRESHTCPALALGDGAGTEDYPRAIHSLTTRVSHGNWQTPICLQLRLVALRSTGCYSIGTEVKTLLTSETVAKIKSYLEDGHRIGEIAAAYQISRQAVSKIASGRTHAGVRPARSVPALSKEADRIRQAKRAAQQQARQLLERAVQKQQVSEFKQQADAAIRDEHGRRLDAERRAEELERQVEELTRKQAQTAPAAHEPEPAPDAERPHSPPAEPKREIPWPMLWPPMTARRDA